MIKEALEKLEQESKEDEADADDYDEVLLWKKSKEAQDEEPDIVDLECQRWTWENMNIERAGKQRLVHLTVILCA